MSYTRVLHLKVAHSHSQMTSRVLRHTAAAMRAHNLLQGTAAAMRWHNVLQGTVEINRCSFPRVRFALLYIVTRSKKNI
jgi:hypothetical protein